MPHHVECTSTTIVEYPEPALELEVWTCFLRVLLLCIQAQLPLPVVFPDHNSPGFTMFTRLEPPFQVSRINIGCVSGLRSSGPHVPTHPRE